MGVMILGGGATGLALAYLLAREGENVTIVEASPRLGGLLSTFEPVPGVKLEHYYHHFFTHDVEINWLFEQLGLSDKVKFRKTSMGVFRDGEIYPYNGARDLLRFKPISWLDRVRFGASALLLSRWAALANRETQPALEWFDRWAGRRATNAIWRPLMQSKFASRAERVPLAWMAGRIRQRAHSRRGSVEQLGYLDGSYQSLIDRFYEVLIDLGVTIKSGTRVRQIAMQNEKVIGIVTDSGFIESQRIVSTVPTDILANFVRHADRAYADELDRVKYLGAFCTILILKERLSPCYWLNVADPGIDFGGVIEQTNFVSPAAYNGKHIVYLSKYLDWDSPSWNMSDQEIIGMQTEQVSRIFKRDVSSICEKALLFRARYAATLTDIGFHERIPKMRSPIDGLFIASMAHVYPDERSVNNSVRIASAVKGVMGYNKIQVPAGNSLAGKYGTC